MNKKSKAAVVKDFMVKNHVWIFVNCQIENPAFDSQVRLLRRCSALPPATAGPSARAPCSACTARSA